MKKLLSVALLCGIVAVVCSGCNKPEQAPATTATQPGTPAQPPGVANTPGKAYAGAPPDIQKKMAEMANSSAKR